MSNNVPRTETDFVAKKNTIMFQFQNLISMNNSDLGVDIKFKFAKALRQL